MPRYVVVNETTHTITGGAYLWDGVTPWQPPELGTLMLETDALEQGYAWPSPADEPAEG